MGLNEAAGGPAANSLPELAKTANARGRDAMTAFRNRDSVLALAVRGRDVELDELYTRLFRELLTYMVEDPRTITSCAHLLFIAKNIERIGDHATNIAEYTHFIVEGEMLSEARAKADATSEE